MKIEEIKLPLGRKVYKKKFDDKKIFYIYCFLCGVVIAMMIAVII